MRGKRAGPQYLVSLVIWIGIGPDEIAGKSVHDELVDWSRDSTDFLRREDWKKDGRKRNLERSELRTDSPVHSENSTSDENSQRSV